MSRADPSQASRRPLPLWAAARLLLIALVCAPAAGASQDDPLPFDRFEDGVLSGDVTDRSAVIWTRTRRFPLTRLEYGTSPALGRVTRDFGPEPPDTDRVLKRELTDLQPGTRYYYRVIAHSAGRTTGASLVGSFRTAPSPADAAEVTFLWSADMSERFKPYRIFEAMRAKAPDFFLFLGDTAYTDVDGYARTLDEYRASHRRNRDDAAFHRFARSTSIYAVWDDHEVANNFDRTHPRLAVGLQAFREYWPIRLSPADPDRLYRSFRWGRDLEVFILDTRQYRSPARQPDTVGKTMLGAAQKAWLKQALAASTATFKVIGTSVTLKYHGADSWEGYTTERSELFDFIRENTIRGVVFLAADVHYAAVIRHEHGIVEGIAGPLAAFINRRPAAAGRPGTEFTFNRGFTFGLVRVRDGTLTIELDDVEGRVLHRSLVTPESAR